MERGDSVIVTRPDTTLTGQMGRVSSIQNQGKTVDVDFPVGGLFRIPVEDIKRVA